MSPRPLPNESARTGDAAAQPTLRDGEVVLRPWRLADVDDARLQHDEQIAHWFGFSGVIPSREAHQQAVQQWHADYADGRRVVNFLVEHRGQVAGTVEVKAGGAGNGELSWAVFPEHRRRGVGVRAVRLLIDYCFTELRMHRVVAHVEPDNLASIRTAGRAGLRREGVARGLEECRGQRRDYVQLARLATDAEPDSRDGFLAVLDAGLPTKRVITQGLIRNQRGELLLCELTYKREWDLPGGVVDPLESPALALVREVAEELRVDVRPTRLAAVNWLPPYRAWQDAMLFVFELALDGVEPSELEDRALLQPREIRALHWCMPQEVERHAAPYVTRHLASIADEESAARAEGRATRTLYLEDGREPG